MRRRSRLVDCAVALTGALCCAVGADEFSLRDRGFVEELALARARSAAEDRVNALPMGDGLTVGAWARQDAQRNRALRLWLRALPPIGRARFYSDGSCDVDVVLTPADLRSGLERIAAGPDGRRDGDVRDRLGRVARDWPVVHGRGMASHEERIETAKPLGWHDVSVEGVELARRSASNDAREALLHKAARLSLGGGRTLAAFLETPEAHEALMKRIRAQATVSVRFGLDHVVVAEASMRLLDLIATLIEIQEALDVRGFHATDFRGIPQTTEEDEVVARGLAEPAPAEHIRPEYVPIELDAPEWANRAIEAVGRVDAARGESLEEAQRVAAGRLAAIEALRKQVLDLVLQKGITVGAFLAHHPELKPDVVLFLSGARLSAEPDAAPDGSLRVRARLPLERLWLILRRGMQRVEVGPVEPELDAGRRSP